MRAIRIHRSGGPEVLQLEDVPIPQPGPAEARVRLTTAGINFTDIYQRTGQYKSHLPFTPGMEGSGVVEATGEGVIEPQVGDRVAFAMHPGAYAEQVVVPAWKLVPVPATISLEVAAALMLQGLTAHYLSHSTFPIAPGQAVLVHAAAGGVGLLLTQLAKRLGAYVIGTVSTEEKERLARDAGADTIMRYTDQDFASETRRLTADRGVHVVYDSVGRTTFDGSLSVLRPRGYLVLYGQSSGPVAPFDPQRLNAAGSVFLTRPSLGHYMADREELLERAQDLFEAVTTGALKVRIDRIWPLDQAAEAQKALEGRHTAGKVLINCKAP